MLPSDMRIDVYVHQVTDSNSPADLSTKLDQVLTLLQGVKTVDAAISVALDTLNQKVTAEKTVEDSAVALLQGLKTQLDNLAAQVADNPAIAQKISDLAAGVGANSDALAAAVTANTPAA